MKNAIKKKYTLCGFAKRLGISRQYLGLILNDKRLAWNYLPLICRLLGISLKQGLEIYEKDFQK